METIEPNDPVTADPTAVFGRRCFAYVIDFLILFSVGVIAVFSMATLDEVDDQALAAQICEHYEALDNGDVCVDLDSAVFVFEADGFNTLFLLTLAIAVLNSVVISSITGGSLGKLAAGVRVVDQSTFDKAGFGKQFLRWILLIADSFPWFIPVTGLILGLASKGHRRIGDFAAKTLVVDKEYVGVPALVPGVDEVAGPTTTAPGLWDPPVQAPPSQPPAADPIASAPVATQPPAADPIASAPVATQPPAADPATGASAVAEPQAGDTVAPAPAPEAGCQAEAQQPGVDAPMWDEARDAYIQWDPELEAWMEWSESGGRWIPISQ
ncbi:MAG: RDD family protein [Acidimicrobiaceae bacterium]|nr:RDD family protein [Acidimicrobiaceae bacterium]